VATSTDSAGPAPLSQPLPLAWRAWSRALAVVLGAVLAVLAAGAWMALPGAAVARQFFGVADRTGVAAWLIGPAIGFGVSVFGIFLAWAAGLQNWGAIVVGPALTSLIAYGIRRTGAASLRLPAFDQRDRVAVLVLLLIVPLVTWAPYAHVRELIPEGEAYRAYFTADFMWAMTVTSELAKGDVPPANPFLTHQPLNYYWMAHFLSGALYRNLRPWAVPSEAVILLDGLMFGLAFVAFLYGLVRMSGASPAASALAVACGFLGNSYEGADMVRAIVQHHQAWTDLTVVNIDAVTRWFYHGMAVDGLQRLLLYQPHHLTGYALGISALWLAGTATDVTETSVPLAAGVLLGLALLFSTFGALIIAVAVALLFVLRLIQQRAWRGVLPCAVLGAMPVAVGLALTFALGYANTQHGSILQLGPNPLAFNHTGWVWLLSFGPLLILAMVAVTRVRWLAAAGAAAAALAVAAAVFYFFTNVPDEGDVWVGWRAGHMLIIAMVTASAAAIDLLWRARQWRYMVAAVLAVLALPATITAAVDIYNAQDVWNRRDGPGFPWTLIITPDERAGFEWLRLRTPPNAVVQYEPYARGAKHWTIIGALAERRMAAGLPGSMIPMTPYQQASDLVRAGIFQAAAAADAHDVAVRMGIDYLLVASIERHRYRGAVIRMDERPDLFEQVFRNQELAIYRLVR
jgi:hypothetical protein